jgi:dihydroneopterin aldolase
VDRIGRQIKLSPDLNQGRNGDSLGYKACQNQITLAGIKLYPHIGTTSDERETAQECQADLTLWVDFEAAAATDSLDASIDYCRVLAAAQDAANACEYSLLETLAYRIVRAVLQNFPVNRVRIKLRKRPAILRDQIDFVEVEVEES